MRQGSYTGWKQAVALTLFLGAAAAAAVGARAGEQADHAIGVVQRLVASGQVPRGTTITLLAKEGNLNNFWGNDFELKREWEERTGTRLDARTRRNLPVYKEMLTDRAFDLTVSRQREYPDLYVDGLIADLTPFAERHGLDLAAGGSLAYLAPRAQTEFDGRVVAIPADGDVAILYLRTDLLDDAERQSAFRTRYGRDLTPPGTWSEYQDLVEFFHAPEQGLFGTSEQRDPEDGWMFWIPRYASMATRGHYLFDDDLRPMIDGPAGWAATESYIRTVPFSPPDILLEGKNYNYTVPLFRSGQAFSTISTMALAKIANAEGSPIRGRFACVPMPGTKVNGRNVRRSAFIYGNNLVVSSASPHPELAFLYAMWLTDPDVSSRSIAVLSGFADPYRRSHLRDERLWPIYTREGLEVLGREVSVAVPEGTGLPGDHEYVNALSENLWRAARGELSARQAMAKTAEQWEAITDRRGRQKQIAHWRAFQRKLPKVGAR